MTLPSPRDLLTSLLSTISSIPVPSPAEENPLPSAPPSAQPLLATLHVLFPSLLLPALDLLDRGLIARVSLTQPPALVKPEPEARTIDQAHTEHESLPTRSSALPEQGEQVARQTDIAPTFYMATSLASTMRRRGRGKSRDRDGDSTREYLVQLEAWNCSCPSFTFDAFPPPSRTAIDGGAESEQQDDSGQAVAAGGREEAWSIGGLSLDGTGKVGFGPAVPCCKHILACVLADKWPAVGKNVVDKRVERAELAGLVARI
jgi:hypothetical protein